MADVVLDASAILAAIKREPGGEAISELMAGSLVCVVNATEVVARLIDWGDGAQSARAKLLDLELNLIPADAELALDAGEMRAYTRHLGLSLGDRYCLALGRRTGGPVYTADRRWAELAGSMDIRLIR